jgi:hypothetical protein
MTTTIVQPEPPAEVWLNAYAQAEADLDSQRRFLDAVREGLEAGLEMPLQVSPSARSMTFAIGHIGAFVAWAQHFGANEVQVMSSDIFTDTYAVDTWVTIGGSASLLMGSVASDTLPIGSALHVADILAAISPETAVAS